MTFLTIQNILLEQKVYCQQACFLVCTITSLNIHLSANKPNTYREAYQTPEEKAILNELLDYLFLKENIIMINTGACMFTTTLIQKDIDRLSEALIKGFKLIKPKLEEVWI